MKRITEQEQNDLWHRHHAEWRDPAQIASQWQEANETDPRLLEYETHGDWWDILAKAQMTLLVTREYEHLVMAIRCAKRRPAISFMRMPHPSGLVVDRAKKIVHIASTRNPNQVYDLAPVAGVEKRGDMPRPKKSDGKELVPIRSRFLPGCLYMHDLALIGKSLYANAVGHNAIVRLDDKGGFERVWWPKCIEIAKGPIFDKNHLQLNSIAAGRNLKSSYFSASADKVTVRRPGHLNFPVDGRGVIFSAKTREPIVGGLTRPHSARLHEGKLWVDNSGYGELGCVENGSYQPVAHLPGWTRGLCFHNQIGFVATSRVIPRFHQYAPGLEIKASVCGVHAVDMKTGVTLGSLTWPYGSQIFAVDWVNADTVSGFPFKQGEANEKVKQLFYAFET
jgi:uncharacterized protein (TIGR03032 family)